MAAAQRLCGAVAVRRQSPLTQRLRGTEISAEKGEEGSIAEGKRETLVSFPDAARTKAALSSASESLFAPSLRRAEEHSSLTQRRRGAEISAENCTPEAAKRRAVLKGESASSVVVARGKETSVSDPSAIDPLAVLCAYLSVSASLR